MEKRKFKFLLGLMTCAFALSALAPIAAEETTQEPGEGTTVVEQTEAPETTVATETTLQLVMGMMLVNTTNLKGLF